MTQQWINMPSSLKKRASCPNHLLGAACADLIMARLQPQPTRERPDTFMQLESSSARCRVPLHGRGGPYILSQKVFQSGIVERRFCQMPFPLRVLVFQRLQPLGVRYVHAAEFGSPFIDAGIADTVLAAKLRDRRASLVLFQIADNLYVGEARCASFSGPLNGSQLTSKWIISMGKVIANLFARCSRVRRGSSVAYQEW